MNSIMRTIFVFLLLMACLSMSLTAQNFEHFKVDTTIEGRWSISSVINDTPNFEVDEKAGCPIMITDDVNNVGRRMLQSLPVDIKREFIKQWISVTFILNAEGEVYNITFKGDREEGIPLTDEQWLEVFDSVRRMKSEIAKLIPSDSGRWRARWTYQVSKFLQETKK